jgi:hypothetical protein
MSFASAGYAGTVIESMLPIALDPAEDAGDPNSPDSIANMKFSVEPTIDGLLSGTWALDANMDESRRLWRDAVELTGLNVFLYTRPGATVLAQAAADRLARDRSAPLFVQQRYGEGRTAVLATGSTWQWQLDADLEDELHERLWRQVVRSLVNGVSAPIHLRDKSDAYTLGNPVKLEFLVRDEVFETREGLRVSVKLKDPEGREEPLAVDESLDVPGLYSVEFNPEKIGSHLVSLEALDDADKLVGRLEAEALIAQPDRREFANPQYNPDFLRRLADETGGRFFTLDRIADIPDRIPYALRENAEKYRIHLWHKPPLFVFALLMLSAEWWIRRKKGYA